MTRINPRLCGRMLALATLLTGTAAIAQTEPTPATNASHMTHAARAEMQMNAPLTSFHLKYSTGQNDANEILTGLRLMMDPSVKLYLVTADNTILMRGLPDDVALATEMVNELDRPRATYRLTFTVTQYDGNRKLSSGDYTMTALDGQRVTMKQGSRIPVVTGKYENTGSTSETQMSYLDVGLNFDATVNSNATGGILKAKVEQSSLPEGVTTPAPADPVFHQTVMEGVTGLTLGRTTPLGTLDSQGAERRTQVEVKLEKLP